MLDTYSMFTVPTIMQVPSGFSGSFIFEGTLFHAIGPARKILVLVKVAGTNRSPKVSDLRWEQLKSLAVFGQIPGQAVVKTVVAKF